MTKIRYKGTKMRKVENGIEILETVAVSKNALCKQCNKEERRNGSSRCNTCSVAKKESIISAQRLSRKIEEQSKQ